MAEHIGWKPALSAALGKIGETLAVRQVALTSNLNYTIPEGTPSGIVHRVAFTQDGTGGHAVTFDGSPLSIAASGSTVVEFTPLTSGWRVTYPGATGSGGGSTAWADIAVSVADHGALGNGVADDTAAIQAAINAAAAAGVRTVYVPDGTYMIRAHDPDWALNPNQNEVFYTANFDGGIKLLDGIHLKMSGGAVLKAIPNDARFYRIAAAASVSNIEISGGKIVGERNDHIGTAGGEWGHGISLLSVTDAYIHDVTIVDCWGDGINTNLVDPNIQNLDPQTPCRNIRVERVVCDNNRRQGMSITSAVNMTVEDSVFSSTHGTAPADGIDVEPNGEVSPAVDVTIRKCRFLGNEGNGIQAIHGFIDRLTIEDCYFEGNAGQDGQLAITCGNSYHVLNNWFGPGGVWSRRQIMLNGGVDCTVVGNEVQGGIAASWVSHALFAQNSLRQMSGNSFALEFNPAKSVVTVVDNNIEGGRIVSSNTSDRLTIRGNRISGVNGPAIELAGATSNLIVWGNEGWDNLEGVKFNPAVTHTNVRVDTAWMDGADTMPDTTAPTAGTLTASDVSESSFTLTVSGASDAGGGLHATPYAFDTGSGTFGAWQASPSLAVTGKSAGTAYTCRHKVRDVAGTEATGASITVTTTIADPTPPVWAPTLTLGTPGQNSVSVTASALATDNVAVTGYEVTLDLSVGTPSWSVIVPTGNAFTITDLTPGTTYANIALRARDASGNRSTPAAAVPSFTTAEALLTHTASLLVSSGGGTATHTFTAVPIGAASASRVVVVAIGALWAGSGPYITGVTIGGVTATLDTTTPPGGWMRSAIARATVPTGTTADVVVTFSAAYSVSALFAYRASSALSVHDVEDGAVATNPTRTITTTDGGFLVAVSAKGDNYDMVWTGAATERAELASGSAHFGVADTGTTGANVTVTQTSLGNSSLSVAVYKAA